ncbi:MAG: 30S ribosomal protein S3 [Candidatus Magasanikbacteria bacterium]|nr:30S ribosomal protein S3 [Candidatus Magasanikbacteria bacterium]
MGHKVHPQIYRTGILFPWASRWVSTRNYRQFLQQDITIREYVLKKFLDAHIDSVYVERSPKNIIITICAAKPGVIIGRGGHGLDDLRKDIERKFLNMSTKVKLNIQEVRHPSLSSAIVAQTIAQDIENRMPFRRVMKQTIERVIKAGANGIKISVSGRLNGAEIARTEKLSHGKIPLITLRSNVDYVSQRAETIYGTIGIKVWIYKGESFDMIDKLTHIQEDFKVKK